MTALSDVIEDRYAGKRYLVEVYPYDTSIGDVATLRFATSVFVTASFDDPSSEPYDDRVLEINLKKEMFSGGALSGTSGGGSGIIRLSNADRGLFYLLTERSNGLRRYNFKRRRVTVRAGGTDSSYLQHEVIFDGLMSDVEFSQGDVVITLADQLDRLDNPLQPIRYQGNREQATAADTENIAIGAVSVTLVEDDLTPAVGDEVWLCRTTDLDSFQMRGTVTGWNSGTKVLDVDVTEIVGTGSYAGWTIYIRPFEGGADLKDQTKPVVIGSCPFVEPVFLGIIAGLYVYQASGDPCIIGSAYVGANTMTEVSYPPGAGEWAADEDRGLIHVASNPSQVITCDVESGGGSVLQSVTFTSSGSTPWVVPTGVTEIDIKAWAAGGGKAFVGAGVGAVGEGGGGGYSTVTNVPVTPGETLTVIVGAGGRTPTLSGSVITGATGGSSAYGAGGNSLNGLAARGAVGGSGGGATAVLQAGAALLVAGAGAGAGYSTVNGAVNGAPGGGASGASPSSTINGGSMTFVRPTGGSAGTGGTKGTVSGQTEGGSGKDAGSTDSDGANGVQFSVFVDSLLYGVCPAGAGGGYGGGASGAAGVRTGGAFAVDAGAGGGGYAPGGTTTAGSGRFPGNSSDNDLTSYQPSSSHAPVGYGAWGSYTIGGNGQVTISYTAFLAANAEPTIGACIREVCRRAGFGNDEFHDIAFEVADALQPAGVGLYVAAGEERSFRDAVNEIANTDLFWVNATADGKVTLGQVRDPAESGSPGTVLHLDRTEDLLDIVRLPADRSLWKRRIGAARCWRPHTQAEIHPDAAEANRLFVQSEYRQTSHEDGDAAVRDASAADEGRTSLFLDIPPATVSAAREVAIFSPERDPFRLVTKLRPVLVTIGDEISVTDETMGLDYTPTLVIGVELIASMSRTILTVWR